MDDTSGRRAALIAMTMVAFAMPFMMSGVNIGLPAIGRELNLSAIAQGWVSTAFALSTGVFLLPFGKIADIYGRKRMFIIGVVLVIVASVMSALAGSAAVLIGSRAFKGIGAALVFATSTAILISVYPPHQRGRVLGINVAAVYVGLSIGPFLGGIMVETLGWRSVLWFNVLLAVLALAFTLWKVKGEWADSAGEPFDLLGSAIYGVSVVALMIGFAQLPDLAGVWLILGGAIAGAAFLWRESRIPFPVLNLHLFRDSRVFTLSSVAALIDYASTFSATFLLSLYLQYIKALSPREAGAVLVAQPIVQAILSPIAGWVSDRIAVRWVASLGLALTLISLVMFTQLDADTTMGYVIACMVVLGLGFGFFSAPNTSAMMGAVRRRDYGVASGLVATMRTFGQMLSMGMVMILFGLFLGEAPIVPANYPQFLESVRVAFVVSSILCAVALVASLARGEETLPNEP